MNLFINFLTAASWIYSVFYALGLGGIIYDFSQLSSRAQSRAKINVGLLPFIIFLFAISFLIARYVS